MFDRIKFTAIYPWFYESKEIASKKFKVLCWKTLDLLNPPPVAVFNISEYSTDDPDDWITVIHRIASNQNVLSAGFYIRILKNQYKHNFRQIISIPSYSGQLYRDLEPLCEMSINPNHSAVETVHEDVQTSFKFLRILVSLSCFCLSLKI